MQILVKLIQTNIKIDSTNRKKECAILPRIKIRSIPHKFNEFKSDLIELQKIRNEINEKLKNTDYHAIITYNFWW